MVLMVVFLEKKPNHQHIKSRNHINILELRCLSLFWDYTKIFFKNATEKQTLF